MLRNLLRNIAPVCAFGWGVLVGLPAMADEAHPLQAVIDFCESAHREMVRQITDYEALLVKRERVKGRLGEAEVLAVKIRHARQGQEGPKTPFSVYIQFRYPESMKGREVVYVAKKNKGQLIVREARQGLVGRIVPTLMLNPQGLLAMQGNRYPVTEIGFEVLLRRVISVAREELTLGNCQVQFRKDAKINDRRCTVIEVIHPQQDERLRYHRCRLYLDDERKCPVRFESYGWPVAPGKEAPLLEEYTYLEVKTNVGLTDAAFKISE
ncbi:MAG: DUF1571 domain-containing protein [Pirellulaceae bacterium]|nr:DUF1571 domain-containing protein [Pirellulaceae bacterium]